MVIFAERQLVVVDDHLSTQHTHITEKTKENEKSMSNVAY